MRCSPKTPGAAAVRRGITLIEILVVLAIIVGIFGATFATLSVMTAGELRGATARLASTIEHIHGRSAINGMRYQLVLDLDTNTYWAECSEENIALEAGMAGGVVGEEASNEFLRYDEDDEEADPFGMNLTQVWDDCTEPLIPTREVRSGIVIDRVLTTHQLDPYEEGVATIGFFPDGSVEQSIIWLKEDDGEAGMTIFIQPITGRVTVKRGVQDIPRDFFDVEEDR